MERDLIHCVCQKFALRRSSSLFLYPWVRIAGPCHWPAKLGFDAWELGGTFGIKMLVKSNAIEFYVLFQRYRGPILNTL